MTDAAMVAPSRRVEMWFAGVAAQNRLTVAFRIILAIPQFIVLYILFIGAVVVAVIGWFAALFMGRLPEWAHNFLGGVIRWYIRVTAYMLLLTDQYPPFSLDDVEYPMRPILPPRGPLNRVSVFFRIILAIPAAVFFQIVEYGLTIPILLVMWFVVLFRGSLPPAFYDAYSALLRYELRLHSWFLMLTSEYAWGMLGDTVPVSTGYTPPPFVPPTAPAPEPAPPAQPTAPPFAYPSTSGDQLATPAPDATPASPPVWPPPQPAPQPPPTSPPGGMPPPSPWERTAVPSQEDALPPWGTLVLQGAARSWMIFAIVWGSIIFVGENAVRNIGHHNRNTTTGLVTTVPADSSVLSHVIGHTPTDF
jgi:Domain of unknown function (DUF4389)